MSYRRRRLYGEVHITARVRQIDELIERIAGYSEAIAASRTELAAYTAQSIWLDRDFAAQADTNLAATAQAIEALRLRAFAAREAFMALPRREVDTGQVPEPVSVAAVPV